MGILGAQVVPDAMRRRMYARNVLQDERTSAASGPLAVRREARGWRWCAMSDELDDYEEGAERAEAQ